MMTTGALQLRPLSLTQPEALCECRHESCAFEYEDSLGIVSGHKPLKCPTNTGRLYINMATGERFPICSLCLERTAER